MKRLAHISDLHFGRIDQRVVDGLLADLTAPTWSLSGATVIDDGGEDE